MCYELAEKRSCFMNPEGVIFHKHTADFRSVDRSDVHLAVHVSLMGLDRTHRTTCNADVEYIDLAAEVGSACAHSDRLCVCSVLTPSELEKRMCTKQQSQVYMSLYW